MKYLFIFLFLLSSLSFSQVINVNPDPNGEPWLAGGVPPLTKEGEKRISQMKRFTISSSLRNRQLPTTVDNSTNKYFRPVFNQVGNSCAQASGIGYIFTYEIGRIKDVDVKNNDEYWFPSHYTWHYINEGKNYGSWPYQGWDIVEKTGCPTYNDFGGMDGGDPTTTVWLDGYDGYYNGMSNRVTSQFLIENLDTEEGLNQLKQYLYDYGNGTSVGGVVSFSALSSGYESAEAANSENQGELVITKWGTGGAHMMTFVGYNDNIKVDLNNDGQYTNNIDINGDGKVTIRDWEVGALKVANSWGDSWGNDGFGWLLYSVIGYGEGDAYNAQNNGGVYRNQVYAITVKSNSSVNQTIKFKLDYSDRFNLTMIVGVAQDTSSTSPDFIDTLPIAAVASSGGVVLPMLGKDRPEPLEMGYNITDLISKINSANNYKLFFTLVRGAADATGTLRKVGLIDYSDNNKEYYWTGGTEDLAGSGYSTVTIVKDGNGAVNEMDEPVLTEIKYAQALTSLDMNMIAVIEDASALSVVKGTIKFVNGSSETVDFQKVSTSGMEHIYKGTFSARNAPVKGEITFTLTDEHNNSGETYPKEIEWADQITIKYENECSDGLGNSGGDEYTPVVKLTSDELLPFYGEGKLTAIKYYLDREVAPGYMNNFEIKVFSGTGDTPETEIYSADVKDQLMYENWNNHYLSNAITLESGKNYWIGYHIKFGYGWFCGLETSTAINGKTNVIKYEDKWTTLTDLGWDLDGRWNIRGVVESAASAEMPKLLSFTGGRANIDADMNVAVEAIDNKGVSTIEAVYYIGENGPYSKTMINNGSTNASVTNFTTSIAGPGYSSVGKISFKIKDTDGNIVSTENQKILWITDTELGYDEEYNKNIGNPSGDRYQPTIKLTSSEFSGYTGTHSISGVRFYLNLESETVISEINSLIIKIYKSNSETPAEDEVVYSYDYTNEIMKGGWQDHILASFLPIDNGFDYWVGYDIDFNMGYITGYDEVTTQNVNGSYIYFRGKEWVTMADWNFDKGQWNLRALVEQNKMVGVNTLAKKSYTFKMNNVVTNSSFVKFNFTLPDVQNINFELFNSRGQKVRSIQVNELKVGLNTISLNKQKISNGFYIYRISSRDNILKGNLVIK